MSACTQYELDKVVARCKRIAPWIKLNKADPDAQRVLHYYEMFYRCPESMAQVLLEGALDKVEAKVAK